MTAAWAGAAGAGAIALASGVADARRMRRADPDRVGWVDWRTVEFVGVAACLVLVSVALNA